MCADCVHRHTQTHTSHIRVRVLLFLTVCLCHLHSLLRNFFLYLLLTFRVLYNALNWSSSSSNINHSHPTYRVFGEAAIFYKMNCAYACAVCLFFPFTSQPPFHQLLTMLPSWYVYIVIRQFVRKEKKGCRWMAEYICVVLKPLHTITNNGNWYN